MKKLSKKAIKFLNSIEFNETFNSDITSLKEYLIEYKLQEFDVIVDLHPLFSGIKYILLMDVDTYTEINFFEFHSNSIGWQMYYEEIDAEKYVKCGVKRMGGFEFELYLNQTGEVFMNNDGEFIKIHDDLYELIEEAAKNE
ncbi:MAG: hypothetical protein MI922_26480 [Bacteroidales bacterium]|nr:hypothetical protein [Bacteroidales bacterium]